MDGMNWELFTPLVEFTRELRFQCPQIDPVYPVLEELERGLEEEQALWYTLLYVAYHNMGSCTIARLAHPQPSSVTEIWPAGVERRGLRGAAMAYHTEMLMRAGDRYGSLYRWLTSRFNGDPEDDWGHAMASVREVWGNGRWACYKTAELLKHVNGFPIISPNLSNANSSGPRRGLAHFFTSTGSNGRYEIAMLDAQGAHLQMLLADAGVVLTFDQLESVLCDFHSLVVGRYYPGKDIDLIQEELIDIEARTGMHGVIAPVWAARRARLPHRTLGEMNGWHGVRKHLNDAFRRTGDIVVS